VPPAVRPALKLFRWCAALGWLSWILSISLLWGQHRAGVLHPAALPFTLLLAVTFSAALIGTTGAVWRVIRGPRRRAAFAWALACFPPLGFWAGLAVYTLCQSASGQAFSKNAFSDLSLMSTASLMEGQVRLTYPHRLESERLVMFYSTTSA
jgi:hypothetical protein